MAARPIPFQEIDQATIDSWRHLGEVALEPNPFAEADFVVPASRFLAGGQQAALVVVESEGEMRFALPVVRQRHFRKIPVPALSTWVHDYCYLGTPLVGRCDPHESWGQALRVMHRLVPWAVLRQLPCEGLVASSLRRVQAERSQALAHLPLPDRPVLVRRGSNDYIASLSKSRRRQIRRLHSRLEASVDGSVTLVDFRRPGPELDRGIDEFLAMESSGWKGQDGGAMACRLGHAQFFGDVCRRFARAGSLVLRSLRVDDRGIAYDCYLTAGDTVFDFKTTYDENYRRYSPGVLLLSDSIMRFQENNSYEKLDSCMAGMDSPIHDLFPDRRALVDSLAPGDRLVGSAATRLTPTVAKVYRRYKTLCRAVTPG